MVHPSRPHGHAAPGTAAISVRLWGVDAHEGVNPLNGLIRLRRVVVKNHCWPEADKASGETRLRSATSAFEEAQGYVVSQDKVEDCHSGTNNRRPEDPPVPYQRRFDLLD